MVEKETLEVYHSPSLKLDGVLGETKEAFLQRAGLCLREKRDTEVAKLRNRFEKKFATLQDRIRRAEDRVEKAESAHGQRKLDTVVSLGSTLIGAFMGRKSVSTAGRSLRSGGRLGKSKGDMRFDLLGLGWAR
jgi:hypothetical protein